MQVCKSVCFCNALCASQIIQQKGSENTLTAFSRAIVLRSLTCKTVKHSIKIVCWCSQLSNISSCAAAVFLILIFSTNDQSH